MRFFLSLILAIILMGCSRPSVSAPRLQIITSFYPMYVLALNVTQNVPEVEVSNLAPASTGCLHDFSLSPLHMERLAHAQVLVLSGGGMESFMDKALKGFPHLQVINVSEGLTFLHTNSHEIEESSSDHEHHEENPQYENINPHIWLSFENAIAQTTLLANKLASIDPTYTQTYKQNAQAYINKIKTLQTSAPSFEKASVVTFHNSFSYLARDLNIKVVAELNCTESGSLSAGELAKTIDIIRRNHPSALVGEVQYSDETLHSVSKETCIPFLKIDSAVTGPENPTEARDAFLAAMQKNLQTLKDTLH